MCTVSSHPGRDVSRLPDPAGGFTNAGKGIRSRGKIQDEGCTGLSSLIYAGNGAAIVANKFKSLFAVLACHGIVHCGNYRVGQLHTDTTLATPFDRDDVDLLEDATCYSGFLKINRLKLRHRLYAGGWSDTIQREIVQKTPGVGVLLYDPELDKVLMVEQFRVGCLESARGPWKLELVAGLIDTDESPEAVAVREVKEEAGVVIDNLFHMFSYFLSPGSSAEIMHLFCARFDARKHAGTEIQSASRGSASVFGLAGENEDIRVVVMNRGDAEKAMGGGIIDNAMSLIALQWLALNLPSVRHRLGSGQ